MDSSHRWAHDQTCKGCGRALSSVEAQKPCPKPYKPGARKLGEPRKA